MPVKEGRINQKEKNKMKQNFYGWIHHARVRQIRKLAKRGLSRLKISYRVGLSEAAISYYAKRENIEIKRAKHRRNIENTALLKNQKKREEITMEEVKKMIDSCERKLEALCENAGISPGRLWVLCEKTEYSLPEDMIPYRHWPEADELIDRDLTLREIAEKVDHKRETIRLYIRNSLQYDYKNKIKVERERVEKLFYEFALRACYERVYSLSCVDQQIFKVLMKTNHSIDSPTEEQFRAVFREYENAIAEGRTPNLYKLGMASNPAMCASAVGRAIKKAELRPLNKYKRQGSSRTREVCLC